MLDKKGGVIFLEKCNSIKEIKELNNRRAVLFSIKNIVDRQKIEDINPSKYEIEIQSGAALTKERIAPFNDFDNFPASISEKNYRYGEYTIYKWIYNNIFTDYIGFCHYRRKFVISDRQLDEWMEQGVDIITLKPEFFSRDIIEFYKKNHYGCDMEKTLEIIRELYPEDYEEVLELLHNCGFHARSMNIFSREMFRACYEWIFPILERLEQTTFLKRDIYQQRDIAYITERLLSIFVDLNKKRCNVRETRYIELISDSPEEIVIKSPQELKEVIRRNFEKEKFHQAYEILLRNINIVNDELNRTILLFYIDEAERAILPFTIFDYIQESNDLQMLESIICKMVNSTLRLFSDEISKEIEDEFICYLEIYEYSYIAIDTIISCLKYDTAKNYYQLIELYQKMNRLEEAKSILEIALDKYSEDDKLLELRETFKEE